MTNYDNKICKNKIENNNQRELKRVKKMSQLANLLNNYDVCWDQDTNDIFSGNYSRNAYDAWQKIVEHLDSESLDFNEVTAIIENPKSSKHLDIIAFSGLLGDTKRQELYDHINKTVQKHLNNGYTGCYENYKSVLFAIMDSYEQAVLNDSSFTPQAEIRDTTQKLIPLVVDITECRPKHQKMYIIRAFKQFCKPELNQTIFDKNLISLTTEILQGPRKPS